MGISPGHATSFRVFHAGSMAGAERGTGWLKGTVGESSRQRHANPYKNSRYSDQVETKHEDRRTTAAPQELWAYMDYMYNKTTEPAPQFQ